MRIFTKKYLPFFLTQWVLVVLILGFSFSRTAADSELLASSTPKDVEKLQEIFPPNTFNATQTKYQEFFINSAKMWNLTDDDIRSLFVVAFCESGWRQYDENGNVLSGTEHKPDKGIFQINSAVHDLDWKTAPSNIESALDLFIQDGLKPWSPSQSCVNKWLSN